MTELSISEVRFVEDTHQYFLGDRELKGITSTLVRLAFPDTYKGIPPSVLKRAAERGSIVHQTLELFNTMFSSDITKWVGTVTPELQAYSDMLEAYELKHLAAEYIVSDNEHFASAIDEVLADADGEVWLIDYKTTSQLHYEQVSLQLSIYARWFRQMNPAVKVKGIAAMWLRGDNSKFQPLPLVPDDKIDELIAAYLNNDTGYTYHVEIPEQFSILEQDYMLVTARMEILAKRQEELKRQIMQLMEAGKTKSVKTAYGSYAYVAASTVRKFDSKAFKEAVSDEEYSKYLKETITKPSIRIKFN